jgi:hypothetical protein
MPRDHIGGREVFVDKQERKTISLGFCGLICLLVYACLTWEYAADALLLKLQRLHN